MTTGVDMAEKIDWEEMKKPESWGPKKDAKDISKQIHYVLKYDRSDVLGTVKALSNENVTKTVEQISDNNFTVDRGLEKHCQ